MKAWLLLGCFLFAGCEAPIAKSPPEKIVQCQVTFASADKILRSNFSSVSMEVYHGVDIIKIKKYAMEWFGENQAIQSADQVNIYMSPEFRSALWVWSKQGCVVRIADTTREFGHNAPFHVGRPASFIE